MKLEDQVCSLEYAIKLKELGVKQESLFYHIGYKGCVSGKIYEKLYIVFKDEEYIQPKYQISAFTVAELGVMLPSRINGSRLMCMLESDLINGRFYSVGYENLEYYFMGTNEANARAEMLIYLIENKMIEVKNA